MNHYKKSYNRWPVFIVGAIEGLIVILAMFCFLLAKGLSNNQLFLYCGIAVAFASALLGLGAYYTRKEELNNSKGESKILKIYQALDIDSNLKEAMVKDTLEENKVWENKWQDDNNATSSLSPKQYALAMFGGFLAGGAAILTNNYFIKMPNYAALFFPFILLGFLGFYKYKHSGKKPANGMLIIALSGIAAAVAAYYAGGLF